MNNSSATRANDNSSCDLQVNPWCDQFGIQQYFEIVFLSTIVVLGVFGNLLVIFSIVLAGKISKQGNVFIINLAIADFLVSIVFTKYCSQQVIVK